MNDLNFKSLSIEEMMDVNGGQGHGDKKLSGSGGGQQVVKAAAIASICLAFVNPVFIPAAIASTVYLGYGPS